MKKTFAALIMIWLALAPANAGEIQPNGAAGKSLCAEANRRLLAFGDSKIALSFGSGGQAQNANIGFLHWVNRLMHYQFATVINAGVNGNDSVQMMARYGSDVQRRLDDYDVIWIDAGVNDVRHGVDPEVTLGNFKALIADQRAHDKMIVWILPPPAEFGNPIVNGGIRPTVEDARRNFARLRALLLEHAKTLATDPRIVVLDPYDDLVDPASPTQGMFAPYSLYNPSISSGDQIHPATPGALVAARRMARTLAHQFASAPLATQCRNDLQGIDAPPKGNFLLNSAFELTTGGFGGGGESVSGNVPASWAAARFSGSWKASEMRISLEPAPPSAGRGGNILVVAPNINAGGSADEELIFRNTIRFADAPGLAAGAVVRAGLMVELDDATALSDISLSLTHNGAASFVVSDGLISGKTGSYPIGAGAKDRLYFETPPYTIPENGLAPYFVLSLRLQWNCLNTAAKGAIKIAQPWIAVVKQ